MNRLKTQDNRINKIESGSYISYSVFRWVIGILILIASGLNGFSIKVIYDTQNTLIDIKVKQEVALHKLGDLQDIIKTLQQGGH